MTPKEKDIYRELRTQMTKLSAQELEILLAEILEKNSVFKYTGQSEPSANTQLKTVYRIMPTSSRARFRVALQSILADELVHTRASELLKRIIDLAAIIGMGEACIPFVDYLRGYCRPSPETLPFLNYTFPTLLGLAKQKRPSEELAEFFKFTLTSPEWVQFQDLSLVAICYLEKGFMPDHLNRHFVRIVEHDPKLRSTIRQNILHWGLMPGIWEVVGQLKEDVCLHLLQMFCDGRPGGFQLFQVTEDNLREFGVTNAGLFATQATSIDEEHPINQEKTYEIGVSVTNPNFEAFTRHRLNVQREATTLH